MITIKERGARRIDAEDGPELDAELHNIVYTLDLIDGVWVDPGCSRRGEHGFEIAGAIAKTPNGWDALGFLADIVNWLYCQEHGEHNVHFAVGRHSDILEPYYDDGIQFSIEAADGEDPNELGRYIIEWIKVGLKERFIQYDKEKREGAERGLRQLDETLPAKTYDLVTLERLADALFKSSEGLDAIESGDEAALNMAAYVEHRLKNHGITLEKGQ